jgi:DNA-binding response OmpR family regulator
LIVCDFIISQQTSIMSNNQHILVVEDEEHLATGIKYNLVAEGYRVTAVGDGPSALKIVQENPGSVDLVILDLMLPGMSGYAVCEALRAFDMDTPVLILTARTLTEDRTRGFDAGANQYLTKPFDLDEFLSRVKNLLTFHSRDRRQGWKQEGKIVMFEFADAAINFETFEVAVHGEPIRLTQLEMTLLRYFVENEGRVIPRRELLENVWGMPGTLNTRAPDQFIRRLRKTFEPDPAQPRHFLTIRDAGYRFVAKPEIDEQLPTAE